MLNRLWAAAAALMFMAAPALAGERMTGTTREIATGTLVKYEAVPSAHVGARNVTVWLPPGYEGGDGRYAVLYMHDGQNLFEPETSYGGEEWGVDEALSRLMAEGKVRDTIVVGVWNTPNRYLDYYPQAAYERLPEEMRTQFRAMAEGAPVSDGYLTFLVEELKPFIDGNYRTLPDRENTFVMGSSMGGLISTYALVRHPETFGAAGAISTHWPMAHPDLVGAELREALFAAMLDVVADGLTADTGRIWFDLGTINLDSHYPPLQARVDAVMEKNGFTRGENWRTEVYEGADHNEVSWRARVHEPLEWLLKP